MQVSVLDDEGNYVKEGYISYLDSSTGFDEDYYVLANSYYFYDIKLAEEEAKKYLESGKYAHVVIRNAVDWEYSL